MTSIIYVGMDVHTSIDSFISGFELAWRLSAELNQYEKERSASRCMAKRLGALSISERKDST